MSPKRARFLVRLYPRAWRARFGAEFQTFLESREVSLLEALDIARSAIVERLREGWRQLLLLSALAAVFTFIAEVGLYTGLERVPRAVWLVWGLIEIPAAILCVPAIRGSGAALCAKLRSWWWLLACDLASLFLQRDWSQATVLSALCLAPLKLRWLRRSVESPYLPYRW